MSFRYKIADKLVWVANNLVRSHLATTPGRYPLWRAVDQVAPGEKWACCAYSLEGLHSTVKQFKDDGLEQPTVEWLISDEGWQDIDTPEMAQEVATQLSKEATFLATKREQEELNR